MAPTRTTRSAGCRSRNLDNVGPAGFDQRERGRDAALSPNASESRDLEGKEIIKAADAREMQTPQMVILRARRNPDPWYEVGSQQYGMGFFIRATAATSWLHHGGTSTGFRRAQFSPVRLARGRGSHQLNGTPTRDFHSVPGLRSAPRSSPIDWSARFKKAVARGKASADSARSVAASKRKSGTQPSHPLTGFAGTYSHPGYGKVTVVADGGALRSGSIPSTCAKHFHTTCSETDPDPLKQQPEWKVDVPRWSRRQRLGARVPVEPAIKPAVFSREK